MTPKERAAMQQALEALEIYGEHAKDCPQYPTYTRPQDYPKCDCGYEEAITAMREALAEQAELKVTAGQLHSMKTEMWNASTQPVQQVDLTDDDLLQALKSVDSATARLPQGFKLFARAVIAADREKNK